MESTRTAYLSRIEGRFTHFSAFLVNIDVDF